MTLFIGQVFERMGRFEDQDMILIVSDTEPNPLKRKHRQGIHMYTLTLTHIHTTFP
jgi:uncharacterized protein (DUF2249 family)